MEGEDVGSALVLIIIIPALGSYRDEIVVYRF